MKYRLILEAKYRLRLLAVETVAAVGIAAVVGAASLLLPKEQNAAAAGRQPQEGI